jgi:hypothetical protein
MGVNSFLFKVVYLIHILSIIVGFGSSFVWPALASRARKLPPKEGYALSHTAFTLGKGMTTGPTVLAGIAGVLLVVLSKPEGGEALYKFSQTWISIAFLLFFVSMGISIGLHAPNLKKIDELSGKLASGEIKGGQGGTPPEVAELQARGKKAAMFGGIIHLLFALLLLDMIWKPGFLT